MRERTNSAWIKLIAANEMVVLSDKEIASSRYLRPPAEEQEVIQFCPELRFVPNNFFLKKK